MSVEPTYPACRPRLPRAEALRPYLERIDHARWYSNYGPLLVELEGRLAAHFGVHPDEVAVVANGTIALTLALAVLPPGRRFCVMPSWTFVATAHAALGAGIEPYFVDVDPRSGALTPELAREVVSRMPEAVAAIMPVAPFGASLPIAAWHAFHAETGIPVIVDAAAGFDTASASSLPTMVSLHATKILGMGEGGLVLCKDRTFVRALKERANFGFYDSRIASVRAWNGKANEYQAAVGLAALDAWSETRAAFHERAAAYVRALARLPGVETQPGWGREWVSATCTVRITREGADAERTLARMRERGVDGRAWWGRGCHTHPAFGDLARDALPHTEALVRSVLSLPLWVDLDPHAIEHIVGVFAEALDRDA